MDDVNLTIEDTLATLAKVDAEASQSILAILNLVKEATKAIQETNRRLDKLEMEILRHWNKPYITYPEND